MDSFVKGFGLLILAGWTLRARRGRREVGPTRDGRTRPQLENVACRISACTRVLRFVETAHVAAGAKQSYCQLEQGPPLVANGDADRMVPSSNSYDLAQRLPNATLRIYPDAGHGGIFQANERFVPEALAFLGSATS